jgi:hypothetical protein
MDAWSSHIPVTLVVQGLGEADGELVRFQAPRTVDALLRKMPLEGRAALLNGGVYFTVPLQMGLEKQVKAVSSGTIAFWPLASALCFFYDAASTYSPVNVVGHATVTDVVRGIQVGTILRVEKK